MTSLSWEAVLAWRARRQHLARRVPADRALDVVSEIAGLHAQVMSCAELTLWARVEDLDPAFVSRALWEERTLVKTWAMRGTLHLLRADELPRYAGALARLRPRHHVPAWLRHHGLTREQADTLLAAIPDVLAQGPLTREALAAAVGERTGEAEVAAKLGGGFGDLLKPAAFTGDLLFADSDGRRVRFARPADWLGGFAPEAGAAAATPAGAVRLLPGFDHYAVVAPRGAEAVLPAAHRAAVYRPQGWLSPVVLLDGRILGVWSHELRGDALAVAVEPFGKLAGDVADGIEAEAGRLAAFLGAVRAEVGIRARR